MFHSDSGKVWCYNGLSVLTKLMFCAEINKSNERLNRVIFASIIIEKSKQIWKMLKIAKLKASVTNSRSA